MENPFSLPNPFGAMSHPVCENQRPNFNNNVPENNVRVNEFKKKRTVYSQEMVQRLEGVYKVKRFISTNDKENLSRELGLTPLQVKIWFQNRRMKEKKIGSQP